MFKKKSDTKEPSMSDHVKPTKEIVGEIWKGLKFNLDKKSNTGIVWMRDLQEDIFPMFAKEGGKKYNSDLVSKEYYKLIVKKIGYEVQEMSNGSNTYMWYRKLEEECV